VFSPRELLSGLDAAIDVGDIDADEVAVDPLDPGGLAQGGNFILQTRAGRIDILQWIAGVDESATFETLRARALAATVSGLTVFVSSREDLVAMKRAAGRPQDLEDLRQLGETVDDTEAG